MTISSKDEKDNFVTFTLKYDFDYQKFDQKHERTVYDSCTQATWPLRDVVQEIIQLLRPDEQITVTPKKTENGSFITTLVIVWDYASNNTIISESIAAIIGAVAIMLLGYYLPTKNDDTTEFSDINKQKIMAFIQKTLDISKDGLSLDEYFKKIVSVLVDILKKNKKSCDNIEAIRKPARKSGGDIVIQSGKSNEIRIKRDEIPDATEGEVVHMEHAMIEVKPKQPDVHKPTGAISISVKAQLLDQEHRPIEHLVKLSIKRSVAEEDLQNYQNALEKAAEDDAQRHYYILGKVQLIITPDGQLNKISLVAIHYQAFDVCDIKSFMQKHNIELSRLINNTYTLSDKNRHELNPKKKEHKDWSGQLSLFNENDLK